METPLNPQLDPQTDQVLSQKIAMRYRSAPPTYNPNTEGVHEAFLSGGSYYIAVYLDGSWRTQKLGITQGTSSAKTATLVIGPSSNSDSSTYDYTTDGTADNVQIQAAITDLPAGGGKIVLREGTYTLAAVVTLSKQLTIEGMGAGTVIRPVADLNAMMFSVTVDNVHIDNMVFNGSNDATSTSPYYAIRSNSAQTTITRCVFTNMLFSCINGTNLAGDEEGFISECTFIEWDEGSGGDYCIEQWEGHITNCFFSNTFVSSRYIDTISAYGSLIGCSFVIPTSYDTVCVDLIQGIVADNVFIVGATAVSGCMVLDCDSMGRVSGNYIEFGATAATDAYGIFNAALAIDNYITGAGIAIQTPSTSSSAKPTIMNNRIVTTRGTSIVVNGDDAVISGNSIQSGGTSANGIYYNVALVSGVDHCIISNNWIENIAANKPHTGINEASSCDSNIIIGNSVLGAVTAQITTVGASTDVSHNITA